jgi:hypothetical protein
MPRIYASCVSPASSADAKEALPCSDDVDGRNLDSGQMRTCGWADLSFRAAFSTNSANMRLTRRILFSMTVIAGKYTTRIANNGVALFVGDGRGNRRLT